MARYAGVRKNNIKIISDQAFACSDYSIVELPLKLEHVSSNELIANYRLRDGEFVSKYDKKPAAGIRLALVGNYGDACGIATYSKFLFEELVELVPNYKIFAERNEIIDLADQKIPQDKIEFCWKRGESLSELADKITAYDPDIVLIQHEFGIWSNARYWLAFLTCLSNYRVIVTLHSTFPNHQDKIVYEAPIAEAIIHLQGAKDNFEKDKRLNTKVHLIPHGCYPIFDQKKLWNNYKSQHTFIQQGFGFQYKNFEASIRATAILKETYPDVFFTALFSESPHNKIGHQLYYNELLSLIQDLGVSENVALIRGYQPDKVIDTYLRSNQVAVFPYLAIPGHEVFGASGAARLAMSAGIPIITSNIPHFSDLPTIKVDTAGQMAQELDKLFLNESLKTEQIKIQNQFIQANSWKEMAERYALVFENPPE